MEKCIFLANTDQNLKKTFFSISTGSGHSQNKLHLVKALIKVNVITNSREILRCYGSPGIKSLSIHVENSVIQ